MVLVIPLLALVLAAGAVQAAAPDLGISLEPPPGWTDVTGSASNPDVVAALKGPQRSSFVLSRIDRVSLRNRARVKTLLSDVLAGTNRKTGLVLISRGPLRTAALKNDLTAHYILAELNGKPRLVLGLVEAGGHVLLGTLISSVPETQLPSLFGEIRVDLRAAASSPAADAGRRGASLDAQLFFSLPEGMTLRKVTPKEKESGVVAALRGMSGELKFLKEPGSASSGDEEAKVVRNTILSVSGVNPATLSPVLSFKTPPGPEVLFASARVRTQGAETIFLYGFMPWAYWGYSIWGTGPGSEGLIKAALGSLTMGASANAALVAKTPPLNRGFYSRRKALAAAGGLAALLVMVLALRSRLKR